MCFPNSDKYNNVLPRKTILLSKYLTEASNESIYAAFHRYFKLFLIELFNNFFQILTPDIGLYFGYFE